MIVLAQSQHQGGERAAQAQAEAAAHPLVSCKAHVHVPPRKGGGLDAIGISKSWFAVLNNPADHGYTGTPQEVCEKLRSEWLSVSDSRTGAWVYCVSAEGLHHVHMVLEDRVAMRFSKIKKSYAVGMHFEATKRKLISRSSRPLMKKASKFCILAATAKYKLSKDGEPIWRKYPIC